MICLFFFVNGKLFILFFFSSLINIYLFIYSCFIFLKILTIENKNLMLKLKKQHIRKSF